MFQPESDILPRIACAISVKIHPDLPSNPDFNQIPTAYSEKTVGYLKVWNIHN
jgi:hypothetical protein